MFITFSVSAALCNLPSQDPPQPLSEPPWPLSPCAPSTDRQSPDRTCQSVKIFHRLTKVPGDTFAKVCRVIGHFCEDSCQPNITSSLAVCKGWTTFGIICVCSGKPTSVLVSFRVSTHLPDQLMGMAGRANKLYTCTITLIWSGVSVGTNVQTEQVVYAAPYVCPSTRFLCSCLRLSNWLVTMMIMEWLEK